MKTLKGHHPKTSAKINKQFGRAIKKLGETDMKKEEATQFITLAGEIKKWFEDREIDTGYTDTNCGHFAIYIQEKIDKALSTERKRVGEVIDEIGNKMIKDLDNIGSFHTELAKISSRNARKTGIQSLVKDLKQALCLCKKEHRQQ